MSELLVVQSKLKKICKQRDCRLSMEAVGVINNKIHEIIDMAIRRAQGERRKTVKAKDVM